jgi:hypothetical protein
MKSMKLMTREVSGGRASSSGRGMLDSEDGDDMVLERSAIGHRLSALVG